jgi:hypothetical protein
VELDKNRFPALQYGSSALRYCQLSCQHNPLSSVEEGLGVHNQAQVQAFWFSKTHRSVAFHAQVCGVVSKECQTSTSEVLFSHKAGKLMCSAMLYLLFWGILVLPCSGWVTWIYPVTPNLTFNYIDVVYFTWTSDITEAEQAWMNLWCAPSPTAPQSSIYGKFPTHHAELRQVREQLYK